MDPLLLEAKEGKRQLYFVDAAHFIYGVYLSTLWSNKRIFIKASPGRKRLNVLGALNAVSNEIVEISNTTNINAWSLVELFDKVVEKHPNEKISIVLDNAAYQRCYVTQTAANMKGIDLVFLPPYSPNLNLIERVWKFVKAKCLNSIHYESFNEFCTALKDCMNNLGSFFKDEVKSLLSWNFQVFQVN